ncbi:hypothetical protein conserved [Entamoeba histolytica]|uniref:Septin-type G domain-containing protein n=3 Tax=Entamoeba histolytica TaxID=5759 RepID=C4MB12_ENTH1|nr:hypothetical protein, conserved [Entamoeba histolytica HM-1:IMSS]EAL47242.1 hypothetical protein, conserved [Entamoeba histolytica HM-1:IMSS]GAT99075.1 hypothetical protein conserved [Entamoeba histolytica]|eukprot:XP_652628.1 hypothetical protein, conserved [Entamoeba histolytica HM-1:IMSS]
MSKVVVKFLLNGKCVATKPLNSQDNLKIVREKIKEKISDSQHFLTKDGDVIDANDEECRIVQDVIDEKRVINIKETEDKKGIRIKINDKIITTIEIDTKTYLSDVRKIVQNIPNSAYFYITDDDRVERDDEDVFTVEDIINNEEINLKEEKENTPEINDITIGICLNGNPLIKKQLNKNISLSDVRKEFENVKQIPKDFVFEDLEGFKIPTDDEQSLKLTSILHDNKVNITTGVTDVSEPSTTTSFLGSPNNSTIPGNSLTNCIISDTSPNNTKTEETDASPSNTDVSEPNIPIEGSKRLKSHENGKLKIYLYPNQPFNQKDENDAIAILVVGETGSGKTTLLNSFVNAIYGIKITDDFRYIIINEDHLEQYGEKSVSQTSEVTIYNIKRTKRTPPIKIIDTPGFGDTRGIEWDTEITKQIKKAFETKVFDLNAICFVASSSNVKLTVSQKYIFGNIINLFGKDVKKNFIAMLTFCDGEEPQVINALKSKDCIFSTIIPEIDEPWYLKFNNSAIYSDKTEDVFTQMFWKLGMKSFDDFITKLEILPRKSLEKSKEVLRKRECIKAQIEGIRISLNNGLAKMNEIKQIYEQLKENQDKVKNNENFTFTTEVEVQKIVDLKSGESATNCNKCHKTCHHPCHVPSLISYFTNILCTCIDFYGYCKVCGCPSSEHVNESRKYEYVIEKKEETKEEVFERYNEGKKGVANAEAMLKKLEEEFYKIQMDCRDKQQEIVECVNTLSEIALNNKVTSSNEYLDMLIQTENDEKKPGYEARIEGYKKLKKANEMIEDIMKNSTTKKSEAEIKAEVKRRMKEEGKSKMNKSGDDCVIC